MNQKTKFRKQLLKMPIVERKRKLLPNHERTRVQPKKWFIKRKTEMMMMLSSK